VPARAALRMGRGPGLVLGVRLAGATHAADGREALVQGAEAAICAAEAITVLGAPRIILRLGAAGDGRNGKRDPSRKYKNSHRRLPDERIRRSLRAGYLGAGAAGEKRPPDGGLQYPQSQISRFCLPAGSAPTAVRTASANVSRWTERTRAATGRLLDRRRVLDLGVKARCTRLLSLRASRYCHRSQHECRCRQSHREFSHQTSPACVECQNKRKALHVSDNTPHFRQVPGRWGGSIRRSRLQDLRSVMRREGGCLVVGPIID
jgi:hypothetical protein